jgi:hypothetical protein
VSWCSRKGKIRILLTVTWMSILSGSIPKGNQCE